MKRYMLTTLFALLLGFGNAAVHAYVLVGSKWPDGQTSFHYSFSYKGSATSPSGKSWNKAFQDAANEWNNQTAFKFSLDTSDPSHPCAGVGNFPQDGYRNGAAFYDKICNQVDGTEDDFGNRVLAVTVSYTFSSKPEEKVETDIFVNDAESWDIYDGVLQSGRFDFKRIVLHELGHALGLGHETSMPAIMQPTVNDIHTLQSDDLAGVAALYGDAAPGNEPIRMAIEEPFNGDVKSGVSTFRGWVVSRNPLTSLTLYRDGILFGQLDHNGRRPDVAGRFPDYPDSLNSGFAFATNFGNFSAGSHQYKLVAQDIRGNVLEKTVSFTISRFDNAFVKDDAEVSLNGASISSPGGSDIRIDRMQHDGKEYRVILRWKKAKQGFDPVEITRTK
ncbi:MAG TPA: matrixin family metalloprotease [Chromatiaceae bacterium]|nr:matrixin family metalloprotease [Chromatiaceae bacterium]